MSKQDTIMSRMKDNYESRSRTYLTRRTPVIMRLDGKAFHTYTKNLNKPFDDDFMQDMAETAKFLCSEITGTKCAYVQSDEISLLITDYDSLYTEAWFDYQVQKMVSVSASLATGYFNKVRNDRHNRHWRYDFYSTLAFFDARVFNIPKEEVANYFYARQKDATKNSISMLAQSLYEHSELQHKKSDELQEMCFQKGVNWNDLDTCKKRGTFIKKVPPTEGVRSKWCVVETPVKFEHSNFEEWL